MGRTRVLLLHGFCSTPAEMRPLGQYLSCRGFESVAPLLPGHGESVQAMRECLLEDWLGAVRRSYLALRRDGSPVAVVGHCLGALLSLITAPELNPRVLICSCPPLLEQSHSLVSVCSQEHDMVSTRSWFDHGQSRRAKEWRQRSAHLRVPVEFYQLLEAAAARTRATLPAVRVPLLVIQAGADAVCPAEQGQHLIEQVRSSRRKLSLSRKAGHGLLVDTGRRKVFGEILEFLTEKENPNYSW